MSIANEEIRASCEAIRAGTVRVDEALVQDVRDAVDDLRAERERDPAQRPAGRVIERLWLVGWWLYETSWAQLQRVPPAFESLTSNAAADATEIARSIERLADSARRLPWPELAPRALGAIRAQALVSSKKDTERGYDDAWILHREGRDKYDSYWESLADDDPRLRLALDETLLQLALAETGTACRTAERVIGRWAEGLDEGLWTSADESRWLQRMFRELSDGARGGEDALELVAKIERENSLVQAVSEDRHAMVTSYRNPGIMTARALLLLMPMCSEMDRLNRRPPGESQSWSVARIDFLERMTSAYRAIERPVVDAEGNLRPLLDDHLRSLVQIRLNLALIAPSHSMPAVLMPDPSLELDPMGPEAVEAMSEWLATRVEGKQRGDANVIGSATLPLYVAAVEDCRVSFNSAVGDDGYRQWRSRWFELDRYSGEDGRQLRVETAIGMKIVSR